MNRVHRRRSGMGIALVAAAILVGALTVSALPNTASATHVCASVLAAGVDLGTDSDNDGLTDFQECSGITFSGVAGGGLQTCYNTGLARSGCLDPDTKDAFFAIVPAASSSLLPATIPTTGFDPISGFSALGVTLHKINANQIAGDRTFVKAPLPTGKTTWPQKAVRVAEDLSNGGIDGYCSWGTPTTGADGCILYTQSIMNFITSNCKGNTTTERQNFFNNYTVHTIMHEIGHTLGGVTGTIDPKIGPHYPTPSKVTNATVMDQSVTVSTGGGKCTFNVSNTWNTTLDPPAVLLK